MLRHEHCTQAVGDVHLTGGAASSARISRGNSEMHRTCPLPRAGVEHLAKKANNKENSHVDQTRAETGESVLPPVAEPWDILIDNRDVLAHSSEAKAIA